MKVIVNLNYLIIYSFIITVTTMDSFLNEQLIDQMFFEPQSKENIQLPREDISLNFTVSSRSSKHPKKQSNQQIRDNSNQELPILALASSELDKFNQWIAESQNKLGMSYNTLEDLIAQVERYSCTSVSEDDLQIIKHELFKKDHETHNQIMICKQCIQLRSRVEELEQAQQTMIAKLANKDNQIEIIQAKNEQCLFDQLRESLLNGVELNLLNKDIKELNIQIQTLRSQKACLQKTYLFNKTKNSQIHMRMELQKSKVLSAAKNSTNSSQLLLRNHQTIVFIDPIQSDVDQWIIFFQNQKNNYKNMCKKQENQRQKKLGRTFTKEEKSQLHNEGKLFVLFSSIKQILKNLLKIRQNTNFFESCQNMSKSMQKQQFMSSQIDSGSLNILKQQNDKINFKLIKLNKINQCLQRQKQNLQQINDRLKQERLRENGYRNVLQEELSQTNDKLSELQVKNYEIQTKWFQSQDIRKELNRTLLIKQEQIQYYMKELNKWKKKGSKGDIEGYDQLQQKIKNMENKFQENVTQQKLTEIMLKSLQFKLKKESLERKRLHNQLEQSKGSFRVYCRIRPKLTNQQSQSTAIKTIQDRLFIQQQQKCYKFDKIFHNQTNSQQKIYQDIKKLVQSAFDGYSFNIFAYGQTGSGKTYTMHGSHQNPGICPRIFKDIFKHIQTQKQSMQVQIQLNMIQIYNDRIVDLFRLQKNQSKSVQIKQDEAGNIYLTNSPIIEVQTLDQVEELYMRALKARNNKTSQNYNDSSRSHFVMSVILQIYNKKIQEKYRTKINLVDLAGSQKNINNDPATAVEAIHITKSLTSLSNVIHSLSNKQNYIPYRDNKLTYLLKDSLTLNGKAIVIINLSPGENNRDQIINSINYGQRLKGLNINDRSKKENQKEEVVKLRRSISRTSNC